eukprot:11134495-Ditylum_brightwellii.AAC.1
MKNCPGYRLDVGKSRKDLPLPQMMDDKEVPHMIYTSKSFDTAASVTSSSVLVEKSCTAVNSKGEVDEESTCTSEGGSCSNGKEHLEVEDSNDDNDKDDDNNKEEHLPAGQHLLVDIKDMGTSFINYKELLAQ